MDLVRDVLDKRVVDRNGRDIGRADRIVLQIRPGQPPRIGAIEVGPSALGHRVARTVGCFAEAFECALGIREGRPLRIRVADIDIGTSLRVSLAVGETVANALEQRLRRWVSALPRSS